MTTTVRIVSHQPDTFEKVRHIQGASSPEEVCRCPQWDSLTLGTKVAAGLRRRRPGMGHVLNEGPYTVRLHYEHKGQHVGPTTDYILPGEFKQLGIGGSVTWWFLEVA